MAPSFLSFLKPAGPPAITLSHDHGYVLAILVVTVLTCVSAA